MAIEKKSFVADDNTVLDIIGRGTRETHGEQQAQSAHQAHQQQKAQEEKYKPKRLTIAFEEGNFEYLELIVQADRTAKDKTAYINRLIREDKDRREAAAKKAVQCLL